MTQQNEIKLIFSLRRVVLLQKCSTAFTDGILPPFYL